MNLVEVKDTFLDPALMLGLKKGEIPRIGHTSYQMEKLPERGVYIWCNGDITYPKALAKFLGREDILVAPSTYYVLDHHLESLARKHGAKHFTVDHAYWDMNKSGLLQSRVLFA